MTQKYVLHRFQVHHFRNLLNTICEFSPHLNCFFGSNGQGKTNFLEAIYMAGQNRSFRKNSSFPQMVSMDGENYEIYFSLLLQQPGQEQSEHHSFKWYEGEFIPKKRTKIPFIFIGPFDAHHFYHTPKHAREWFDNLLSLYDKIYAKNLNNHTRLIRQRNDLLERRPLHFLQQIKAIDHLLSETVFHLITARTLFLKELAPIYPKVFRQIFGENLDLKLEFSSKVKDLSKEELFTFYQTALEKDLQISKTFYSVHKDNYLLSLSGLPVLEYASIGQQKTIYLSLLFAYVELFVYKFGFYPIVLIDDLSSELDNNRWGRFVTFLQERDLQVFMTTANELLREKLENRENIALFQITAGQITRM